MARASRGSKQQARTIAYALARPLRGLRRGFEVGERLGHLFPVPALRETDENLTEIIQKRRPEGPKSPPEPLGASRAFLGLVLDLLWASWDAPGALPGRSREPLGSFLGLQKRSRRPPAPELDFRSILGAILAPFWDPPDLKKHGFRVGGVAISDILQD